MLSFKTRSYIEGIWNAICWVEYKTRRWDVYNLDFFIIEQIKNGVPIILEWASEENIWYKDVERLGILAKEISYFNEDERDINEAKLNEFLELLPKTFGYLWY